MNSYLSIVPKYLKAHQKKTNLVIASVAISVALVSGIFSMLDFFLQFEKIQQIHENGNYHLNVTNATVEEMKAIDNRIDVKNSGTWIFFRNGKLNGNECRIDAMDEKIAPNMQVKILKGKYPAGENEMALEKWASEKLNLKAGDTVKITFAGNTEREFIVSGIYSDYSSTKATDKLAAFISVAAANTVNEEKLTRFYIEFKDRVNINAAQRSIQSSLGITDDRIGRNEYLLAAMGQSKNNQAEGLYATGAVLFCIVLIAGVMMIYNTFNISVLDRIRQFGLLKCIGASQSQIKKMVRREGLHITLKAVPIGVVGGMLLALICSSILKFYNRSYFGEMILYNVSMVGIAAGIVIGFLTVFIASSLPARKAAKVSPVNAVTGSSSVKLSKRKKQGFLTRLFPAEIAMGMNNAVMKKRTLFLMSCSIAISIIMFLGFQVFIDFLHVSMKTTKPYTPDISLISEEGIDRNLYEKALSLDGVKKVYGRMFAHMEATFDASRLTDAYKESIGGVSVTKDGLFIPPEKSWFISYEQNQLNWAKKDLIEGELSEEKLNKQDGIIAVAIPVRNGISMETASFHLGDKVYIETPSGKRELTIMAILRTAPFSDDRASAATFITTEKLFSELTGESDYKIIDLQLQKYGQEQTVSQIRSMLDSSVSFRDQRQKNQETDQAFMTMAVFLYGFVIVIALISILNIINTMNTSVASKTKYLGVMRAVGMCGTQLDKMAFTEAVTYSLMGSISGCLLGIVLQKALISAWLSQFHIKWKFPFIQVGLILVIILLVAAISIINPLRRIKAKGISEVIGSLQ